MRGGRYPRDPDIEDCAVTSGNRHPPCFFSSKTLPRCDRKDRYHTEFLRLLSRLPETLMAVFLENQIYIFCPAHTPLRKFMRRHTNLVLAVIVIGASCLGTIFSPPVFQSQRSSGVNTTGTGFGIATMSQDILGGRRQSSPLPQRTRRYSCSMQQQEH